MNYNNMMKNWKNFLNDRSSPPTSNEILLNESSPEVARRLKKFGERPIEEYPFGNLFGDKRRQVIFMQVKPDGKIFDIIEFFEANGWEVKFGDGVVTKELNTPYGVKRLTLPIMKALLKIKNTIEGRYVKPEKFFDEHSHVWTPYTLPGTHNVEADAPKKARNLNAEYKKIFENGQRSYDRLVHGPVLWFWLTGFESNLNVAANTPGPHTYEGRDFQGKEVKFTIDSNRAIFAAQDKLQEMFPEANVERIGRNDLKTGEWVTAIKVYLQSGAEFPRLQQFELQSPEGRWRYADKKTEPTKLDNWIKYLNTPVPDVKKSGPALDYYQRNPEILEAMDIKPVIITRDTTDIGRMSDFGEESGLDSCHTEGHSHDYCALREADAGGLLAYMYEPEDMNEFLFPEDPDTPLEERGLDEIQEALDDWDQEEIMIDPRRDVDGMFPKARIRLRRYINDEGGYELALPDPTVYGDRYPGFNKAVTNWALENQEGYLPENYAQWKRDDEESYDFFKSFVYTGGSYHRDAESGEMFNNFLGSSLYNNADMVQYDPQGKYEESSEYQVPDSASEMEAKATLIEDGANLDHGHVWFEVHNEEDHPWLNFSGDFVWTFGGDTDVRADKSIPAWNDEEKKELQNEIEAVAYEENFYYSHIEIQDDRSGDIIINISLENDETADDDGFGNFVSWMEQLDDEPWEKARKKMRHVLRKMGYLEVGEALDNSALEALKDLKNFAVYKTTDPAKIKNKDFSFELKNLLPIGYGYNMPQVLARTYWAREQQQEPAHIDYHRAYRDLRNGYDLRDLPVVRWYAMGKDLFQFIVREVLGTEPEEQLELPLQEATRTRMRSDYSRLDARTAQERAEEAESFAGSTVQGLEKYLENFIVNVRAVQQVRTDAEASTQKGWEEFGKRRKETGSVERGIQTTVPIEMDIEFDIDEEDTPNEVGLGIQILLWMDKNLDQVQEQAGYLLQKYNDVYLKEIDYRIKYQRNVANEIETLAAQLSKAAEEILTQMKSRLVGVWEEEYAQRTILNTVESLLVLKKRLMEELLEWDEDTPMVGSLLHRYKRAQEALVKLEWSTRVRDLIVNQLKTLRSSNPAYYRKVVELYVGMARATYVSDEQAKEMVINGLTRLYQAYVDSGSQANVNNPDLRKWLDATDMIDWDKDPYPPKTKDEELEDIFEARIKRRVQGLFRKAGR